MGLGIGANALTSGITFLGTILLVIMGILLVSSSKKVEQLPEFNRSSNLQKLRDNIKTAYILTFIAAGLVFLISIAYGGHESAWCPSEWWHGTFAVIALIILVIAVIFAYVALNDLYNPELEDTNGSVSFIWAYLVMSIFAFLILGGAASARVGYNVVSDNASKRINMVEKKFHEVHSAITGKPNEYEEPKNNCEDCVEEKEAKPVVVHQQQYQPPVRTQFVPNQVVTVPRVPTQMVDQPVGPPIVTRHSVVTTSQPMLSSPVPQQVNQQVQQNLSGFI